MMPTGFDNAFICGPSFPHAAKRFAEAQLLRWPGLLLNEEPADAAQLASWSLPGAAGQGGENEEDEEDEDDLLTFCRDAGMNEFWDENGYALDPTGEGPFALFFGRYTSDPLYARELKGVSQTREPGKTPMELEGVGLLLPEYYAVTLVTPDDPTDDPFSAGVLQDLLRSFGVRPG
jgi:hypothetical protein